MLSDCKYKHVIWDWNGTLLDDAAACVEILNLLRGRRGMGAIDLASYRAQFDFPVEDYYRRIGFDLEGESFEVVAREYIEEYNVRRFDCRLRDGAESVLERLGAMGLEQSVLSAYQQDMLDHILEHFAIRRRFRYVMGLADHYAASKVDNGVKLMGRLGIGGDEAVFVGDTVHDWETAEAMGIGCILIDNGHQERSKLEGTGAVVVDGIGDVLGEIVN